MTSRGTSTGWHASLAAGKTDEIEARVRQAKGDYRSLLIRNVPLRDELGNIVKWYGTGLEIEDRKRAEEALRQAQADLEQVNRVTTMGELTASLAHEVNQPIAAAVTNANTCLRWLAADPQSQRGARGGHANREERKACGGNHQPGPPALQEGTPQRELVDLNEVISRDDRPPAQRGHAILHISADGVGGRPSSGYGRSCAIAAGADEPHDQWHRCDEGRGRGARARLSSRSERNNEELLVSVGDTGVGLPPQQADQILQCVFYHQTSRTAWDFASALHFVESHSGRLWLPTTLRAAQVFTLLLPAKIEAT